jgi:hypothetical protein
MFNIAHAAWKEIQCCLRSWLTSRGQPKVAGDICFKTLLNVRIIRLLGTLTFPRPLSSGASSLREAQEVKTYEHSAGAMPLPVRSDCHFRVRYAFRYVVCGSGQQAFLAKLHPLIESTDPNISKFDLKLNYLDQSKH